MADMSWLGPPIDVRTLFGKQHDSFTALLRELRDDEWTRPTVCPGWSVKDIAAHVLGDHVSRLARHRDRYRGGSGPRGGETLPVFLDRVNGEWVTATRRISPRLLTDLLSSVGEQVVAFWQTVHMDAPGEPVSWADPGPAPVWLDAARDFSEYWTHQQQICDATGRPGLTDPEFMAPVLDTFLRALPHTLRDVDAAAGTAVRVTVTGPSGSQWTCVRDAERWRLDHPPVPRPAVSIELDPDTAWRLCTRGISPSRAADLAQIDGDARLALAALQIVSIIWTPPG
jgi:uncharacterized protein (TIGR03083 family)